MSIELVTGHAGSAHVTSAQDGRLNAAAWGTGKYVLPLQGRFAITVNSANSVTVSTGDALLEGRHVTSEAPTALTVDSGTQGMHRNDIVALVYAKDGSGVESAALQVVKGTETSGTPTDPDLPSGSVLAGDTACAMALWRLPIDGIALGEPNQLFTVTDELSANDNTTYDMVYAADERRLTLASQGGASSNVTLPLASGSAYGLAKVGTGVSVSNGIISVPTATTSRNGLMTSSQAAALASLSTVSLSGGAMGFGYQNSSGMVYIYVPVNAVGKSSATVSGRPSFTLSGNGTSGTAQPGLGGATATLRNGGSLLEISFDAAGVAMGYREVFTAWCSSLSVTFS